MLDDDNFYDDAVDTLETFIGCGKKQKNNWEADIQVEDMNMDEKQYNSDESHSTSNSDEEGTTRRYKEFNIDTDMDNPQFDVAMKFPSKKVLKQAIQIYGVLGSYECKVVKNDKFRLSAKCKEGCKWRLYASLMQGENTYQIKSYTPKHSCSKGFHNKNITSTFLSQRYMSKIKDDPKIKKTTLQLEVHRELGYEVSTDQCYKAKRKAQTLIEGTYAQQYEKLWEYCEEIRQTNNDNSVDACHLRGTFQGQLLVAVDIDATDNKYPIAYAIAELESKDSWCWFPQLLIEDFGPVSEYSWTFISDQQKGLDKAFELVVLEVSHRCVRHLYGNFKKKFKGQALKDQLWSAAMSSNEIDFNCEMEKLRGLDEEAYGWLTNRYPNRTCSCRRWELNGIPCMHAVSAIFHNRQEAEQFVDKCYTREAYLRAYSPVIQPVKSMKYWPKEATSELEEQMLAQYPYPFE
ncbi:hypothetical protein L3X38_010829 [Prunus dulcis]|uniref:SWIM-type domain-containing protein n=1 Tax=Prunus dulcis TaxID=3755 RepID=A0AAD4ZF43_PRUDU|nr:hypothetical protein L3X38_010829 [Prunus dulcis]